MASSGSTALLSDYNTPQSTANSLWLVGSGNSGYGQNGLYSSALSTTTTMGVNEWNNLRYDLFNIRAHQIGTNPAISIAASSGNNIVATDATNFGSYATQYNTDRLTAHASRISTTSTLPGYGPGTFTRTASWTTSVQVIFYMGFGSPDQMRYFFNTGGTVRFSSSRTGGAATSQNTAWTNLLSGAGTRTFSAGNFYALSGSYSTFYDTYSSSPYASNHWLIESYYAGASLFFRITWIDPYVDPPSGTGPLGVPAEVGPEDIIDGTLTLNVDMQYATGGAALAPTGAFRGFGTAYGGNYNLPTYVVTSYMTGG